MLGTLRQELEVRGCDRGAGLLCTEACDFNPLCQQVLTHSTGDHAPICVTTSIEGRLPEKTRIRLERVPTVGKPPPNADEAQLHEHMLQVDSAYSAMKEIVRSSENFLDGAKCLCARHRRQCQVHLQKRKGSVLVEVAGTTCKDFSRRGIKQGIAGPSAKPFVVWLMEIRVRKDIDAFVQECTEDFIEDLVREELGGEFHIDYFVWNVVHQGWGVTRPRKYVIGIRIARWFFVSSLTVFARVMGCRSQLTAEDYFVASPDQIQADLQRRYAARGLSYTDEPAYLDTFPESTKGTILLSDFKFRKQMQEKGIPQEDWQWPVVDGDAMVLDKMHEDSTLRTVVTHGTHFSLNPKIWRPLLGDELLMTQGVPMCEPQRPTLIPEGQKLNRISVLLEVARI